MIGDGSDVPHTSRNGAVGHRGHESRQGRHPADTRAHSPNRGPDLARLADLLEESARVCRHLAQDGQNRLAESTEDGLMSDVNGRARECATAHAEVAAESLLSATKVGELLGVSERTVRRWRQQNKLPAAVDLGGVWRWKASDIAAWIEEHRS